MKTPRKPLDYYATPEPVSRALCDWLVRNAELDNEEPLIDPAAGDGAIIRAFREDSRISETHWTAIELDPEHGDALDDVAEFVMIGDALRLDWYSAHVIANPPFSKLDEFWQRIVMHRETYHRWCACLIPVGWWHAQKRAGYVRPDYMLALGWRPSFVTERGLSRNGTQDYAWCVLAPHAQPFTRWERIEKPERKDEGT